MLTYEQIQNMKASLRKSRPNDKAFIEVLEFTAEMAEYDCEYDGDCPPNGNRKHGECKGCRARRALSSSYAAWAALVAWGA